MALIRFEGRRIFVGNVASHFEDIRDIDAEFAFDLLICDVAFFAMKLVKEKLGKRVYAVDVATSNASDPNAQPIFVGMKPASNAIGRLIHQAMRVMMDKMSMGDATPITTRCWRPRVCRPSKALARLAVSQSRSGVCQRRAWVRVSAQPAEPADEVRRRAVAL